MEALERRGKMMAIAAILFIVFWSNCKGVAGQRNSTKMSYVCPPHFVRLGHSCYFLSDTSTSWQNAFFACKDRDSNLTVPARWEDRHLRNYLNRPEISNASRWIGGIYDYSVQAWKWGGELKTMHYQSFSKMKRMSPEELQWHCIAMMPELLYRWQPRNCLEPRQYICKAKLRKVPNAKAKELRRRWLPMGVMNEINAPNDSREEKDQRMLNDATASPVTRTYDVRPATGRRHGSRNSNRTPKHHRRANELKQNKHLRPTVSRQLRRPFPGFHWNRRDPEGSFQRNALLLRSGRTGLRPQQIKAHLARLQHLRDVQIARRNRLRAKGDWLVNDVEPVLAQTQARTYTMDNNISALHPKTIVEEFDIMPPPAPVAVRPTG